MGTHWVITILAPVPGPIRPGANFPTAKSVETDVFGTRHRRPSFTDPLNWTDYRWDTGPWRHGGGATPGDTGGTHGNAAIRFSLLLFAGIAAVIGAKLFSSLQSRNTSWARRGLYAALLLLIVGAFSQKPPQSLVVAEPGTRNGNDPSYNFS